MSFEENLKKLKIELPDPPAPVGSYTAYIKSGNFIFVSGQISLEKNGNLIKGKLGADVDLNLVLDEKFQILEIQGTAEGNPFSKTNLDDLFDLAKECVQEIFTVQS